MHGFWPHSRDVARDYSRTKMTSNYGNKQVPLEKRIWPRIEKTDGCWNWTGGANSKGYGIVTSLHAPGIAPYRWVYQQLVGPIPKGMHIDHLCRNIRCCNPAHLEAVTPKENNRRSMSPSAMNARKTHCPRGHELANDNLMISRDGGRHCRICRRSDWHRWKARKREG